VHAKAGVLDNTIKAKMVQILFDLYKSLFPIP